MDFGPHLMLASLEGAVISAILVLTAMGLSIVFGVMRVVNVAHGEFFMLGAVLTWVVTTSLGGHPAVGFLAALIVVPVLVGCIAAGADRLILKRVHYDPDRTIVATIGILYIIQQTTLMTYGPEARPVEAPFNTRLSLPWFEFGENGFEMIWPWGLSITTYKLFVIFAAISVLIALWLVLTSHQDRPDHAGYAAGQGNRAGFWRAGGQGLFLGFRPRCRLGSAGRGFGCSHSAGALPHGS